MVHFTPKKKEHVKQFLDLFQALLALHSFTKRKKLSREMFRISRGQTDSRAGDAIYICVQKFRTVLKRKKGNGTKLTKIHQMTHVAFYEDLFGSTMRIGMDHLVSRPINFLSKNREKKLRGDLTILNNNLQNALSKVI